MHMRLISVLSGVLPGRVGLLGQQASQQGPDRGMSELVHGCRLSRPQVFWDQDFGDTPGGSRGMPCSSQSAHNRPEQGAFGDQILPQLAHSETPQAAAELHPTSAVVSSATEASRQVDAWPLTHAQVKRHSSGEHLWCSRRQPAQGAPQRG